MDNQSRQKIDSGETDKKNLLASDTASRVNNDSQMADLGSVQTPFLPMRFLIVTIGGIFLAEVIAMIFVYDFQHLPYYQQVLLDAGIMVVLIFPIVYYFSLRPLLLFIQKLQQLGSALQQSEERFALAYRSNPAALSITRVEDGSFIEVNDSFLRQFGYTRNEVIGHTLDELNLYPSPDEWEKLKWLLLKNKSVENFEMTTRIKSGELRTVSISTEAIELGGEVNILTIASDITERKRSEDIMQARLRLMQFATSHTLDELLQNTLDEIEALTSSTIGFFHFLEPDQKTLSLQAWSTNTLQNMCKAVGKDSHYSMDQAGVWADCARQRKPIIHNDYEALPAWRRKGMPEGHAPIIRELTIPVLRNEKLVAILGVGNKLQDYIASDVEMVSTLADFAWDVIERKRADDALVKSEEKFRTLVDWTYDWEKWLDPQGNIVYTSPSCGLITGFSPEAFMTDSNLLLQIIHPDDRHFYEEHQQTVHNESIGPLSVEYRIIAKDGSEHWIEHNCRPLYGKDNRYLGRRISNRDITERKRAEETIRERDQRANILSQTIYTLQMDIARDLHDTVGQNISYLRMKLDHIVEKKLLTDPDIALDIKRMSEVANESYDMMRGTLAALQLEDTTDLSQLFFRYATQIEERSTFRIDFVSHGKPKQVSANQMRQLFYIFREVLSNIEKHANASEVTLDMTWDEVNITLVIFDNGCGFDSDNLRYDGHYGLRFVQERLDLLKGSISIYSAIGAGSNIIIQVPYEQ